MDICGDQALFLPEIECDDCKLLLQRLKNMETQLEELLTQFASMTSRMDTIENNFSSIQTQVDNIEEFISGLNTIAITQTNDEGDVCVASVYGTMECFEKPRACSAVACEARLSCVGDTLPKVCEAKVCDAVLCGEIEPAVICRTDMGESALL